jgi:hypothetical protein
MKSEKLELVGITVFVMKYLKLLETLCESFPQMIIQSVLFLKSLDLSLINENGLNSLQIHQLIRVFFCVISISYGNMDFIVDISKYSSKKLFRKNINLVQYSFKISRFLSNLCFLISRTLPISFLFSILKLKGFLIFTLISSITLIVHLIFINFFQLMRKNFINRIIISLLVCLFKLTGFVEQFQFNFNYLLFHFLVLLENVAVFITYFYLKSFELNNQNILIISIIIYSFWIGLLIEIIHWKLIYKYKSENNLTINNLFDP